MSTEGSRGAPIASGSPRARRAASDDGLFIVGLLGRAGSGKTTVARALAADGARLLEADRLSHEITDHDAEVRVALAAEYGADVYRPDGTLNRARVAARVFHDSQALARLNALVHPRIVAGLRAGIAALRRDGFRGTVVVDAAVMLSWGFERDCDAVLAVIAPEEALLARLTASRGWSERDGRARFAAQPTQEQFAAAADAVLDNRGTEEALVAAARAAVARLASRRAGGNR